MVTTNHESSKYFCDKQNLKGPKAPWADLIPVFDFSIRYRKGSMNTITDALSHIREVNMLSFIEITSYLYDHLRGKYLDDNYFAKYWTRVKFGTNITTTSKESFHIANGLLYRCRKHPRGCVDAGRDRGGLEPGRR